MSEHQKQPRQTLTGRGGGGDLDRETKTEGNLDQEGKILKRNVIRLSSLVQCVFQKNVSER